MKVHYKTKSGRLVFELEGQSPKQLFAAVAEMQELFEADSTCGCCNGTNLRLRVRTPQGTEFQFYEMYCEDCTAALGFGERMVGNRLYPQRKDKESGALLPNRGWKVWKRVATASKGEPVAVGGADDVPF